MHVSWQVTHGLPCVATIKHMHVCARACAHVYTRARARAWGPEKEEEEEEGGREEGQPVAIALRECRSKSC